jgi:SAM-dependent methyltransferase
MDIIELIACPLCKSVDLEHALDKTIECRCCRRVYHGSGDIFDMSPDFLHTSERRWDAKWEYWQKMQSIYKNWVRTDWSLEAAKAEIILYQDFMQRYAVGAKVILDLGGFWGMNRNWLDGSIFYFVIDPDDEEIRSPQMHYLKEIFPFYGSPFPFIKGVGEYLPVRSNSVDLIIIQDALDHFLFPQSVIHECYRVLGEDGRLVIMADVMDVSARRNLGQNIVFVLKKKGLMGLARGVYWKCMEMMNPSVNRHGHINEFSSEDIKKLLSIFRCTRVEQPEVGDFPHMYFESQK